MNSIEHLDDIIELAGELAAMDGWGGTRGGLVRLLLWRELDRLAVRRAAEAEELEREIISIDRRLKAARESEE
jgi:hypothetical protein